MVFFGTPSFSASVLDELVGAGMPPSLVVTTPDRPKGRKLEITPPPVKVWAKEHKIEVLQPQFLHDAFIEELIQKAPGGSWDLFVVAAYGEILRKELIELPKHGTLNVHPSLLPRWRGASPIQSTILNDDEAGVTIMLIDEEMDHGPILSQAKIEVENWPPKGRLLSQLLATEGGKLLAETIPGWIAGRITPEEQKHEEATYTKKIKKEDGLIDLSGDPKKNYRKIQAYDLWPGAYFMAKRGGKDIRVKITDASLKHDELVIERVVPEGKQEMSYQDFLRGS